MVQQQQWLLGVLGLGADLLACALGVPGQNPDTRHNHRGSCSLIYKVPTVSISPSYNSLMLRTTPLQLHLHLALIPAAGFASLAVAVNEDHKAVDASYTASSALPVGMA